MKTLKFLLLALLPCIAFSQAKVGTAGGQFLEIGVGARAVGMGGAFSATSNDISAVYYNPGGLGALEGHEAMFTHISYFADMSFEYGAFSMPINSTGGVAAISISSLNTGDIDETTPSHPEGTGRTFNANSVAAGLTYSQMLTDRFSCGVTWKFINEKYADVSARSWAVDIGTIYRTAFHDLRIGIGVTNFGPDLTFISLPAPLPMSFHLGLAAEVIENDHHTLTVAFDMSHPNDDLEKFRLGTEYWYDKKYALRAGFMAKPDSAGSFAELPGTGMHFVHYNLGAGFKIPISAYVLKVDYALEDRYWLDIEHRFTFGLEF